MLNIYRQRATTRTSTIEEDSVNRNDDNKTGLPLAAHALNRKQ